MAYATAPLRSRKQTLQGGGRIFLEAGRDVGVAVPGDRHATMPEQFAHDLDVDVRQQQEACRRVAQIVEADNGQASALEEWHKVTLVQVRAAPRQASRPTEHKAVCVPPRTTRELFGELLAPM